MVQRRNKNLRNSKKRQTMIPLNSHIQIPSTSQYGTLKYLGEICVKNDGSIWAGVELFPSVAVDGIVTEQRGKNSGAVGGRQYFHCSTPGQGLFIAQDKIHPVPTQHSISKASPRTSLRNKRESLLSNIPAAFPSPLQRRSISGASRRGQLRSYCV
jgi:dynactin complex subunit